MSQRHDIYGEVQSAGAGASIDVMDIDICGPVSRTLEVVPSTPAELSEAGRLVREAGTRWCEAHLDQRISPRRVRPLDRRSSLSHRAA